MGFPRLSNDPATLESDPYLAPWRSVLERRSSRVAEAIRRLTGGGARWRTSHPGTNISGCISGMGDG